MRFGAEGAARPQARVATNVSMGAGWLALWLGSAWQLVGCADPAYPEGLPRQLDASSAAAQARDDAGSAAPSDSARPRVGDAQPPASQGAGTPASDGGTDANPRPALAEAGVVEPDAAGPVPGVPDAGPVVVTSPEPAPGALPAWALPLVGTYAVRSVTFSYDDAALPAINTRNVDHSLLTISRSGEELLVTRQLCSYAVSVKGGQGTPPLSFTNAARTPPLKGRIVLGAPNTFSTAPMLQHLGFDPTRASCEMGSNRRTKFGDQTWYTATTCVCYATSVPEHVDDCRVIDGDGDGKPGLTAHGPSPLGTTEANYLMVFDYSLTLLDGQVDPSRMHTLRELRAQAPSCISAATDGCSIGNNQLCPGGATKLLPVDEGTTCATLNMGDFGPPEQFPVEIDCRASQAQ
jgi:hypothetical protein